MPTLDADSLRTFAQQVFAAAGTPSEYAATVAEHLVNANLAGHDSHGIQHIPGYIAGIRAGQIVPAAAPAIVQERPTAALVSGHWGFGQVAAKYAMDVAIRKVKEVGVTVVGIVQCNHIGRLGEYVTRAAAQGLASLVTSGNLNRIGGSVAPYGGRQGALSTSPMAWGFPAGPRPPFLLDFATSVIAGGKVEVALAKGESLPEGAAFGPDGRPTTDPVVLRQGGSLRTFGGHKGYGLALVVGLFGGLLTHADRYAIDEGATGVFILAVDVGLFGPSEAVERTVDQAFGRIKATPPAEGFDEVLISGETEHRSREQRRRDGIPIPAKTWMAVCQVATELGVAVPAGSGSV